MKTFLLAWNPDKWKWDNLNENIDELHLTGHTYHLWSIASYKKAQIGDRVFLMRLGKKPKGLMASGFITTAPELTRHWGDKSKSSYRSMIDFDVILHPEKEPILELDILNVGNLSAVNWTPQSSGMEIIPDMANELEKLWFDFLLNRKHYTEYFTSTDNDASYLEGSMKKMIIKRYERNPYARKICIEHYGLSCCVCGFNFQAV